MERILLRAQFLPCSDAMEKQALERPRVLPKLHSQPPTYAVPWTTCVAAAIPEVRYGEADRGGAGMGRRRSASAARPWHTCDSMEISSGRWLAVGVADIYHLDSRSTVYRIEDTLEHTQFANTHRRPHTSVHSRHAHQMSYYLF